MTTMTLAAPVAGTTLSHSSLPASCLQQQLLVLCPTPVTPRIWQFTTATSTHPARAATTTKAAMTPPGAAPSLSVSVRYFSVAARYALPASEAPIKYRANPVQANPWAAGEWQQGGELEGLPCWDRPRRCLAMKKEINPPTSKNRAPRNITTAPGRRAGALSSGGRVIGTSVQPAPVGHTWSLAATNEITTVEYPELVEYWYVNQGTAGAARPIRPEVMKSTTAAVDRAQERMAFC